MPNLATHAALAVDDGFRRRMQAALVQLARSVAANANAPQDQKRLASSVLAGPEAYVARYAWQVAADTNVLGPFVTAGGADSTQVPDAALEGAVQAAMQSVLANDKAAAAAAP